MRAGSETRHSFVVRLLVATLVVALWIALGWFVHADPNEYLLLGVPLTLVFQRFVRGRPLHSLWVRDAPGFQLDRAGVALAGALAITPAYALIHVLHTGPVEPVQVAWLLCAVSGAAAGGFALRRLRRAEFRALLGCLATAGTLGVMMMFAAALARGGDGIPDARIGIAWLLLYLPVTFVLEEVFFRGALDTYVHRRGEGRGWASAIFVSVLWGLWHLPIVPRADAVTAVGLLIVHTAVGVPLSIYWRQSGNLTVPAVTHAVIDGFRNALLT